MRGGDGELRLLILGLWVSAAAGRVTLVPAVPATADAATAAAAAAATAEATDTGLHASEELLLEFPDSALDEERLSP